MERDEEPPYSLDASAPASDDGVVGFWNGLYLESDGGRRMAEESMPSVGVSSGYSNLNRPGGWVREEERR